MFQVLLSRRWTRPVYLVTLSLIGLGVTGSATAWAGQKPKVAPEFAVKGLDGKTLKLSDFEGKAVVLDFWATWCGPCRASMPHLNELQNRYRDEGLVVLGLSVDEMSPRTVARFAKRLGVEFRLAMANDRVMHLYGPIRSIPTTVFIARNGHVVRRVVGYVDAETMESYARETLQSATASQPAGR